MNQGMFVRPDLFPEAFVGTEGVCDTHRLDKTQCVSSLVPMRKKAHVFMFFVRLMCHYLH